MESAPPRMGQVLRLALPALFVAQFLVWPLAGLLSPRLGIVAAEVAIVWFLALFIGRHNFCAEDLLLFNAVAPSTLLAVLPTAVAASLLIGEFDLYVADGLRALELQVPAGFQRSLLEIQLATSAPELLAVVASVALVPGIGEELFFRGFVFSSLYAHYGPRTALGFSALLFAAAHFNPWQLPALFFFGLFLALLAYSTHSIYPPILAHVTNNALSIAGINLRTYLGVEVLAPTAHLPLAALVAAALVAVGGLLFIARQPPIMPLPARAPAAAGS